MSQLPNSSATRSTDQRRHFIQQIRLEWILMTAIAIAALIRIIYVGGRELWYDEVLSLLLSTTQRLGYTQPPDTPVALADYGALLQLPPFNGASDVIQAIKPLLQGLVGREPHPPLFFLSQYLWLPLTGTHAAALRSLNLLLSLGAILGGYGMGKALFNHRGGLLLAALLGVNPFFWFHSLNMRMYCPTVLWITLSGWATLQLCSQPGNNQPGNQLDNQPDNNQPGNQRPLHLGRLGWYLLLTLAIAAGILTYYLSALWFLSLGCVILINDRKRWWQYGLCGLGASGLVAPWLYWGIPQQLRNVDLKRFSSQSSLGETMAKHVQGLLEVLGIQLTVGDWATSLPTAVVLVLGGLTLLLLATIIWQLWCSLHQDSPGQLFTILILGCLPLGLMLGSDIASGKFTLSWGVGRSAIFILPGLLLLITAWLMTRSHVWQKPAIITILVLYLSLNVGDMAGRHRQMFQQIAATATPSDTTLIALNSKAWGHVLRLAYYFPNDTPVKVLATDATSLPEALESTLSNSDHEYDQILWLESGRPVWNMPTKAEAQQIRQDIDRLLGAEYQLVGQQELVGTMALDRFSLNIYGKAS